MVSKSNTSKPTGDGVKGNLPGRRPRSKWILFISILLAVVLLYFTLRGLDWKLFWVILLDGHYGFLFLTIPIAAVNYFIRAIRWSIFISFEKKVPIILIFWSNMVGYMGNAFLPARAGELLRSAILGTKSGLGPGFVLATAMAERVLDVVALVLIGSISLIWLGNLSPLLINGIIILAFSSILVLALMIIAPAQEARLQKLFSRIPASIRIAGKISEQISLFLNGMRSLRNGRKLLGFLIFTLFIWLIDGLGTIFGVRIISQTLNIGQALVLLAALGLSSALPSTPGYLGIYQFIAVTVLTPFGFSKSEGLAYILISQVVGYLIISFFGLIGLWQINHTGTLSPKNA